MNIQHFPTNHNPLKSYKSAGASPKLTSHSVWRKPPNTCALAVRAYGHTVIGALGEAIAAAWLSRGGYSVRKAQGADLAILDPRTGETLRIEVKTARRGQDGKWRATLCKAGHTHISNSDVLVFLCVALDRQTIPFVIPAQRVANRNHIVITSDPASYGGRWAEYRVSWEADPLCL